MDEEILIDDEEEQKIRNTYRHVSTGTLKPGASDSNFQTKIGPSQSFRQDLPEYIRDESENERGSERKRRTSMFESRNYNMIASVYRWRMEGRKDLTSKSADYSSYFEVQKLNSPTWTVDCYDEPDSERNISMLKKEGMEFFNIFSATPYKIIEKLTTEGVLDPEFLKEFFLVYRSFLDSFALLRLLILRLEWTHQTSGKISNLKFSAQQKTLNIIKYWVDNRFPDFEQNIQLTCQIRLQLQNCINKDFIHPENIILTKNILTKFGVTTTKKSSIPASPSIEGISKMKSSASQVFDKMEQKSNGPEKIFKIDRKKNRLRSVTNRASPPSEQMTGFFSANSSSSLTKSSLSSQSSIGDNENGNDKLKSEVGSPGSRRKTFSSSPQKSENSSPGSMRKPLSIPPKSEVTSPGSARKPISTRRPRSNSIGQKITRFSDRISRALTPKESTKEETLCFIFSYRTKYLAQQLCLLEQKLVRQLTISELSELSWTKKRIESKSQAKNVHALIDRFNDVSRWVSFEIVSCYSMEMRARLIEKFIRLAENSLAENNFSLLLQIDLGLQRQEVFSLKKTWALVGSYEKDLLKKLRDFTNPARNFKELREAMDEIDGCASIPFLGLYLSDLVFNSELPSLMGDNRQLVNLTKFRNKGSILRRAMKFAFLPLYNYEEDIKLQMKLSLLPFGTDSDISRLAHQLE